MKHFFAFLFLLPAMLFCASAADYNGYIVRTADKGAVSLYSLPEGVEPVVPEEGIFRADSIEDISRLWDDDELLYIEPNYYVTLFDEPALSGGPALFGSTDWPIEMLGARTAWTAGLTGEGIRVGIIDSGIYREHEDFSGVRIERGHNYINGSSDTSDSSGHGTFIAGLIAAAHNGKGIDGIAPDVEIIPMKCFEGQTTDISFIVSALWDGMMTYQCDVINMSFGTEKESQTLKDAVDSAAEKGIIICAAAGNKGTTVLNYPAAYDSVIGVGMVNSSGVVAAGSQRNESVWVTAPGSGIYGLGYTGPSAYRTTSGTSFSCPCVSAVAALLRQKYPGLTVDDLLDMLSRSAVDRGDPGYDTAYGCGLVSLPNLLETAPPQTIRLKGEDQLYVHIYGLPGTVFAAFYDSDGRMLRCLPQSTGEQGLLDCLLPLGGSTARVRLLCLDEESLAPLRSPLEWRRGADTPDGDGE